MILILLLFLLCFAEWSSEIAKSPPSQAGRTSIMGLIFRVLPFVALLALNKSSGNAEQGKFFQLHVSLVFFSLEINWEETFNTFSVNVSCMVTGEILMIKSFEKEHQSVLVEQLCNNYCFLLIRTNRESFIPSLYNISWRFFAAPLIK